MKRKSIFLAAILIAFVCILSSMSRGKIRLATRRQNYD